MNIREKACKTLMRINNEGAYSNLEVKSILKVADIKDEDRRLYLSIVYGTLQNQIGLDYLIQKQINRPLVKIQKEVLTILRIAYYQLYFLDRIPDYAIVNESVLLAQKLKPKAKGFVNGVLRNQLRKIEKEGRDWSFVEIENRIERISTEHSMPLWICQKYIETFAADAENIIKEMSQQPPFTVRCNNLKIKPEQLKQLFNKENIIVKSGCLSHMAFHLEQLDAFHHQIEKTPLYQQGLFSIQDQGAMLTVEALGAQENEIVLDMCAAPGGKTTYLSQIMNNTGKIIARDIYPNRLKLIKAESQRLGCQNIDMEQIDGTQYEGADFEKFDRILLDAPCSGLGVIRRKPEIRYQITKETIKNLIKIQESLLKNAGRYLKKGGFLLYATCTINRDENENQIETFLRQSNNFELVPIDGEKYHHTHPLTDGCDGFFMCLLKKSRF
ncbi:16S rRNA (cytosine(967)-C(5))-methyltransferase RsmB [Eubacteriaceae bacterium ES3]|nr:16S rRNA (cytosine(967)-C(5))-methyltransferase RsmB [Eubacteriaceae bacterium ES3]